MSNRRRIPIVLGVLLLALGSFLARPLWPEDGSATDETVTKFEFIRLNRIYRNLGVGMKPASEGPLTVRLTSPENVLVLRRHSLEMRPVEGDLHAARIVLDLMGEAKLDAEFLIGGTGSRLEDEVKVPPQEIAVDALIRMRRVEDGYEVETVELPASVSIAMESRLGGELVSWCERIPVFFFLGLSCDGLDSLLSEAVIPLPKPGEVRHLAVTELQEEERQALDLYLSESESRITGGDPL
jgi:hypothetical protein